MVKVDAVLSVVLSAAFVLPLSTDLASFLGETTCDAGSVEVEDDVVLTFLPLLSFDTGVIVFFLAVVLLLEAFA